MAFVFLAAGLGKLGSRASIRPFLEALGIAEPVAIQVARAVPVVEIACAVALFADVRLAAGVALVLSVSFLVVLLVAVRLGATEGCRCFGAMESARISSVTILRAGVLVAACVALLTVHVRTLATPVLSAAPLVAGATTAFVYIVGFAVVEQVRDFERRRQLLFVPPGDPHPVLVVDGGDGV